MRRSRTSPRIGQARTEYRSVLCTLACLYVSPVRSRNGRLPIVGLSCCYRGAVRVIHFGFAGYRAESRPIGDGPIESAGTAGSFRDHYADLAARAASVLARRYPHHVYSIHRGALKTYRVSADSSEWISGFHFPGEVLGLDAVIDRPVRGGAVALNTVTVCLIPVSTLVECFGRSPAMRSQLLARFGDEITRLEEHLSLDALSAERRLAAFILWVVNKLSDGSAQPTLSLPMSHKEIGNYLRLVPETVSRLLARFHERGMAVGSPAQRRRARSGTVATGCRRRIHGRGPRGVDPGKGSRILESRDGVGVQLTGL